MMEGQNEGQAPVDEDVRKAKQGKVTGIIIPPPDIRAVVDKTAQFVARNGKSFEQRILSSGEGKTAKFNFMKQFDPYHAYYEQKIRYTMYLSQFFLCNTGLRKHLRLRRFFFKQLHFVLTGSSRKGKMVKLQNNQPLQVPHQKKQSKWR
jgi:hypothetical protein